MNHTAAKTPARPPRLDAPLGLLVLLTLVAASGASCPLRRQDASEAAPALFTRLPTAVEAVQALNANADRVQQVQAEAATLSVAGVPALRANLAIERPRRFRLRAELMGLSGPELDLGSNDDLFWMWVKRSRPQPALYFCRHDQFAYSPARHLLPIEPQWLIESLGLLRLEANQSLEGPFPRGAGTFELRVRSPSPQGDLTRILVIHESYGWILEQHLYDAGNRLVASVKAGKHRFYEAAAASLPRHLEIRVPQSDLAFQLDVSDYVVNRPFDDAGALWTLPQLDGYPVVDLAGPAPPTAWQPPSGPPPNWQPPAHSTPPHSAFRPRYRGYSRQ